MKYLSGNFELGVWEMGINFRYYSKYGHCSILFISSLLLYRIVLLRKLWLDVLKHYHLNSNDPS